MKAIIGAYSVPDRVIGRGGVLPWDLPADMQFFRDTTRGATVIMGRATWESIPEKRRPLPNRQNIVLSRSQKKFKEAEAARDLAEAFQLATHDNIFVIGGAKVYEEAIARAAELGIDTMFITEVQGKFEGDAFFPDIPNNWRETSRRDFPADDQNPFPYSFITYRREI